MTNPEQQTLRSEATFEGVGVHSGAPAKVRFLPAEAGQGIRFRRVDLEGRPEIAARLENVVATEMGTCLAVGEARVDTVEHLLAAAVALGVDNMVVEIDGPEVPIGDGSFLPFLDALARAGTVGQGEPARVLTVGRAGHVELDGGTSYTVAPAEAYQVSASIDFAHPLIGRQFASFEVDAEVFEREIAPARTFGFLRDAEALRARGLARGTTWRTRSSSTTRGSLGRACGSATSSYDTRSAMSSATSRSWARVPGTHRRGAAEPYRQRCPGAASSKGRPNRTRSSRSSNSEDHAVPAASLSVPARRPNHRVRAGQARSSASRTSRSTSRSFRAIFPGIRSCRAC